MAGTGNDITAIPLKRERLVGWWTRSYLSRRCRSYRHTTVWKRNFKPTNGKEPGSVKWYYNAPKGEHRPNITLVPNRGPGYGIWVGGSLPKIRNGSNSTLLTEIENIETLDDISNYVTDILGRDFDAHKAVTGRIDYSADQNFEAQ